VFDAQDEPVAGAIVILCDQNNGVPVYKKTYCPFTDELLKGNQALDIAYTISNEKGQFTFENIPAGEYRLVAQSWRDVTEFKGIFEKNGKEIELHGIAEHVKVSSDSSPNIVLRPLGTGILQIDQDVPNDEVLLVISTSPTRADPILGFAGWGGAFMQNMIGGNRMKKGQTRIYGLPEGKIYLAMFAADSVPGWTEGQVEIKPDTTTTLEYIPFVNSWSNSRHDPPEHLVSVFEELKQLSSKDKAFIKKILKDYGLQEVHAEGMWTFMAQFGPHLDKEVELPSRRKTTFGDLMAAVQYIQLKQAVDRRQAKRQRQAEIEKMELSTVQTDDKADYEEAFFDLYRELGEKYPCFEMKGIDWKAVGQDFLPRAENIENDQDFGLLCMELVARLEDNHANLLAGTAKLPEIPIPRWDPGFACLEDDRGKPVVYYVDINGPADKAGVKIGMTVVSINDKDAQEAINETMDRQKKYIGYSSGRYLRYHAYRFFVRQENKDCIVKLKTLDTKGKEYDFEFPAAFGVRYLPRLPVPKSGIRDSGEISWKMLDDNIGYIYVRRIGNNLISLLDKAVGQLQNTQGIIIDVRGNSGGGFDSERAHLNFAPDKDSQEPNRPRYKGPLALLIDSRCISAGEGWASWFMANKRARFFGRATAGASSRKTTYQLKNGLYKVRFPVKAYKGYLDRPIERLGLIPDVKVSQNAQDIIVGRDTVLETAKKYLLNEAK
jgi:C-terminal processing protease CtpA/Prc